MGKVLSCAIQRKGKLNVQNTCENMLRCANNYENSRSEIFF